ncbi:S-layer homology domain-containing protein [Paenibacillus lycopersici]|uniref:S-layer homology domain-containing protein n=1 Tax=Paenibacillus lycopersici TaxID=2704462 RepID=A0A6C0FNR2_9BACL|nr:S-layer homology domain-containing protein [Paenibacillus lycopersici]QHT58738.1 S-layer homology domain-containing protein [Paenibacillus lycopersici]
MKKWKTTIVTAFLAVLLMIPAVAYADNAPDFTDVDGTYWAKDAIDSLVQLGVVKGFEDNTFKPGQPVTREQFAQLIAQAFYLDLPGKDAPQTFRDVSSTRWSFQAVEAAKDFLTGYYPPNGKAFFDPAAKATREDVAVALVKTMNYQPDDLENPSILDRFYDGDDVSPNLRTYVGIAIQEKLMSGYENNTIKPGSPVTRAEAAALIYRVIKGASSDGQAALELNVDAPETTTSPTFYITGDVTKGAKVFINSKQVDVVQGQFRVGVQLEEEGTYTYTISARMAGGKTETVNKKVVFEKGAPTLEVSGVPEQSDKQTINVSWKVKDANDSYPTVYLNGKEQSQYSSSASVELVEGDNVIIVKAENAAGKTTEVVKHVTFNVGGPTLNVGDLPETTDKETVTVTWTTSDKNDSYPDVYVNDVQQSTYSNSTTVKLKEGSNTIVVKATNELGKSTKVTKTVTFNPGTSTLKVGDLPETTDKDSVALTWTISDTNDSSPTVFVNGEEQSYYSNSKTFALQPGANTITVRAVNKLGKATEITKTVTFNPPAPTLTLIHAPETASANKVTVSWTVSDKNDSGPVVYVGEEQQSYYTNSTTLNLNEGTNTFKLSATNKYGKTTEVTYTVTYAPAATS